MDHNRFDALARALAGASTRRAALAAALATLLPLTAEGKRKPKRDPKPDRRAKDRERAGGESGPGPQPAAPAAADDAGERGPANAACLPVGRPCGPGTGKKGRKGKRGKKRKNRKAVPCTKCCSRHAVVQSNGARRCACKPAGAPAGNPAQCCSGRISAGGFCGACDPGLTECNGTCVDTTADDANCGACGNACQPGQRCADGACVCDAESCTDGCCDGATCKPGTVNGACGRGGADCVACGGAAPICSGQTCTACSATLPCPDSLLCCGGACVQGVCCTAGDCGGASNSCVDHRCRCGGREPCSGRTPDCCGDPGTCTNTDADPANCGACGNACAAGEHCYDGVCRACHDGPIQQAVEAAEPGDTIYLCPKVYAGADGRAEILTKDLTFVGAGDGADEDTNTVIRPGDHRAFSIGLDQYTFPPATVTIRGLRVEGASASFGGAVANAAVLTLEDCTLADNEAWEADGGAIYNTGELTLTRCTVTDNTAEWGGGGIFHGFITVREDPRPTCTISDCTITGNTANLYGGGGIQAWFSRVPMLVRNSTISGNTAVGSTGGAIDNTGGYGFELVIEDCTISGNQADRGGGISNLYTDAVVAGTAVTGNTATESNGGGGLYQWEDEGSITLERGTVVSDNTGGNCAGSPIVENGGTCIP